MTARINKIINNSIIPVLSPNLKRIIKKLNYKVDNLIEIRLRSGKPLIVETLEGEVFLDKGGNRTLAIDRAYRVRQQEIKDTLNLMTKSSLFTYEEEIRAGFFTLKGGHRVGLVGEVISDGSNIKRIKHISALNIRLCQEIIGAADVIIKDVIKNKSDIYNTLIISPPRCGKTTLLRDLTRQLSTGVERLRFKGLKVGIVDERSELGGAYQGLAQNDLGIRSDLLDRCPKAKGMMLLIRSMSPDIIVTDEIGSAEDVLALEEAINAGVRIITTVHGSSLVEVKARPSLQEIIKKKFFQRVIILSYRQGPGTVERIIKM